MEIARKSIEQQLQIQDQSVVYQLRRSCHKIEELKEEIEKLRRDKDSQLVLLATLQQQLKDSKRENAQLQDRNIDLIAEIESLSKKIRIIQSNDECLVLQQQLQILKGRYYNCQQQNSILRQQLRFKEQTTKVLTDKLLQLSASNKKQQLAAQSLRDELEQSQAKIVDFSIANSYLQQENKRYIAKEKQVQALNDEYKELLLSLHLQVGRAQRGQEGWFCQFNDLKQTVEHIQEARTNYRLKKTVKNQ